MVKIFPRLGQFENGDDDIGTEEGIIVKPRSKVKRPKLYKVLLHNDDYTTMEFVVLILQNCFSKTFEESQVIMLKVHQEGVGVCGIYTHEVAESKVAKVLALAKEHGHPLQCSMEEE